VSGWFFPAQSTASAAGGGDREQRRRLKQLIELGKTTRSRTGKPGQISVPAPPVWKLIDK